MPGILMRVRQEPCGECALCRLRQIMEGRGPDGELAEPPEGTEVVFEDDDMRILSIPLNGPADLELVNAIAGLLAALAEEPQDEATGMLIEDLLDQSTVEFAEKQRNKIKR